MHLWNWNPEDFNNNIVEIEVGQKISRNKLLNQFVTSLYSRSEQLPLVEKLLELKDTVDVFPAYADVAYRIHFGEMK